MKERIIIPLLTVLAALVVVYTALVIYVFTAANQDTKMKSDAIVVLGEGAMGGTSCFGPRCQQGFKASSHYSPCLIYRIDRAVSLYKNHYAPKILMSGGTDKEDGVNEAGTMKKIAIQDGIPEADILTEDKSTSTYEDLAFSQKILNGANLHSAIIVTDPSTDARAEFIASKLHYTYSLSPDANISCTHLSDYVLREPLAIIYYFLSGKYRELRNFWRGILLWDDRARLRSVLRIRAISLDGSRPNSAAYRTAPSAIRRTVALVSPVADRNDTLRRVGSHGRGYADTIRACNHRSSGRALLPGGPLNRRSQ